MSVINLSTAYVDRYVNAPKARALVAAGQQANVSVNPVSEPSTFLDNAKAIAAYIPGDVLTLFVSANTAIQHATFVATAPQTVDGIKAFYLVIAFWVCLVFTPLWAIATGLLASSGTPSWKALLWPAVSGTVAFVAYAFAVPGSYLAPTDQNYGFAASFAVIFVTPLLHICGLLYTKYVKTN